MGRDYAHTVCIVAPCSRSANQDWEEAGHNHGVDLDRADVVTEKVDV